jgi:hypothetical protein
VKIQWERAKGKLTDNDIEAVEKLIRYRLPLDYISVFKEHNGARPVQYNFDTETKSWTFARLYELKDKPNSVVGMHELVVEEMELEGVVPFGADIAGNLYCFDYRQDENRPSIVFIDHEGEATYVCESFTDMINRLY